VGDASEWAAAEAALARAVESAGLGHQVDPGGGAFYGPKLDVHVEDSLGRKWQLSTIQLDFNLPRRFDLSYVGADGGGHRPFVLHRAIFGSLERFFGILVEHYGGAFPPWLAPVQAKVLPVSERHREKAREVIATLRARGVRVEPDDRGEPLSARVRDGELQKIPFLLVIGDREIEGDSISVRTRGSRRSERMSLSSWAARLPGQ
jgi:threonyl-tRNA synthetase